MLLDYFSKKPQFHLATYFICAVLLAGCAAKKTAPVPQVATNTILSVEDMQEDLAYTVRMLKEVHPQTYHGLSDEQQATIQSAYKKIQTPMKAKEFYFVVNSVICSMNDGHTHLRPMQNEQNRCIDVPLIWLHDGLYVSKDREQLKQGDRVVAIGTESIDTLFHELRLVIPSENEYYSKKEAGERINREEYLHYLDLVRNDSVQIRVLRSEEELNMTVPLKPETECQFNISKRPWVGYEIDKELSLGVLYLDSCNYNDLYKKKVVSFFKEVSELNIRNIAIDVRHNGGGNSNVVIEFMRYLDVDEFNLFHVDIRYSKATKEQRGYNKDKGYQSYRSSAVYRNKKVLLPQLLFSGNVYVLTSPETFSSGNWFSVIIKDNQLGTIIGEPTGNAPTHYGDILSFCMPITGYKFTVSFKKWIRPNTNNDPEDSLYPDVTVYTTIEDIIQDRDPQLTKLKEMISNAKK